MFVTDYQQAYTIYHQVIGHKRFSQFKNHFAETWELNRQYLHFLFLIGRVKPDKDDKTYNNIRLGRFLNQVPSFAKDKQGMNMPVLIIQLCILIQQKKHDAAEERVEALEKYLARHVRKNNPNYRSNLFLKMLLQVPIAGFQKKLVQKKAQKYIKKMEQVDLEYGGQSHAVEIIPYATLWKYILEVLD